MVKLNEIIQKILSYDDPIYFKLPIEINEKIIKHFINFKESKSNEKKNKNFRKHIKELSCYFKLDLIKIVKLLYFNINSYRHLLYDYNTEIALAEKEIYLSYIFYATLLIEDNQNIINYSFTIDLIKGIEEIIEDNNNIYLKLILSKSIFDLINSYKGLDEYNNNINKIKDIEIKNTNRIENLIHEKINRNNELKLNLNLTYIKSKKIDQIYIDIIIGLLKNKSEDYNYIYIAITKMKLESIIITKTMFEEVKNFLDKEINGIKNKYLISKIEDLFDINKINFFYILLKYILKTFTFICQIKLCLELRKNLLRLCKSNSNIFSSFQSINTDNQIKDKLNYILEVILNSEYYIKKSKQENSVNKYNISNSVKKIGEHIGNIKQKYTAEFITEIQDIFISCGTNNELIIYDDSYSKIISYQNEDWIYNAFEFKNKINKTLNFLAYTKKKIYVYSESYKISEISMENNLLYLLFMESSYYFSCCENNVFLYNGFLDKLQYQNKFRIYENKLIKSAIKINYDLVAFKSNKIVSKGISNLLIFNLGTKKDISLNFIKKDEEYSFIFSPLGQVLITHKFKEVQKDIENKILLFACKKYLKSQKNGILLLYNLHYIKGEEEYNKVLKMEVDSYFHNTHDFEPYCICHLKKEQTYNIFDASFEIKETDYFLVGGFEKKIRQGMIKLYKIIYGEKLSIEFIQDVKIFVKKFEGLKGPISCIIQTKKNLDLLITCWDGNVYFIGKANIYFYLKQDELIEKSANDFFKIN